MRLLHPDALREKSLKRFAEFQMKRVSRAYAVLSDPERRRSYDAELAQGGASPEAPVAVRRTAARSRARTMITFGWLICAFAGVIGIGWYVSQQSGAPPAPVEVKAAPPQAAPGSAAEPAGQADRTESSEAEPDAATTDRDRAQNEIALANKQIEFLENLLLAPPKTVPGVKRFNGVWVMLKTGAAPTSAAYAPESADLILAEEQGAIQGRFRARYPTAGRPEPVTVRFYFEGKGQSDVANLNWTGDGGAKGQIQLRLVSENALELVWTAAETGSESGPSSGAALLVRRP